MNYKVPFSIFLYLLIHVQSAIISVRPSNNGKKELQKTKSTQTHRGGINNDFAKHEIPGEDNMQMNCQESYVDVVPIVHQPEEETQNLEERNEEIAESDAIDSHTMTEAEAEHKPGRSEEMKSHRVGMKSPMSSEGQSIFQNGQSRMPIVDDVKQNNDVVGETPELSGNDEKLEFVDNIVGARNIPMEELKMNHQIMSRSIVDVNDVSTVIPEEPFKNVLPIRKIIGTPIAKEISSSEYVYEGNGTKADVYLPGFVSGPTTNI